MTTTTTTRETGPICAICADQFHAEATPLDVAVILDVSGIAGDPTLPDGTDDELTCGETCADLVAENARALELEVPVLAWLDPRRGPKGPLSRVRPARPHPMKIAVDVAGKVQRLVRHFGRHDRQAGLNVALGDINEEVNPPVRVVLPVASRSSPRFSEQLDGLVLLAQIKRPNGGGEPDSGIGTS